MMTVILSSVLNATSFIHRVKDILLAGSKLGDAMQTQRASDRTRPPTASRPDQVRSPPYSTSSSTSNSLRVPPAIPSAPPPPDPHSDSSDDEDFYVDVRAPTPSVGSRDQRPSIASVQSLLEARRPPIIVQTGQNTPAAVRASPRPSPRPSPRLDRDDRSNRGPSSTAAESRRDSHPYVGVIGSFSQHDGNARHQQRAAAQRLLPDTGPYVLATPSAVGDDAASPAVDYEVLLGDKSAGSADSYCCVSSSFLLVSVLVNLVVTAVFAVIVLCWLTGAAGRDGVLGVWRSTLLESVESLGQCVVERNAVEEGDAVAVEDFCSRTAMNDTLLRNVLIRTIRENEEFKSAGVLAPVAAGQRDADRPFSAAHLFLRSDTHLSENGSCLRKIQRREQGLTSLCGWSSQGEPFYSRNVHLEQIQNIELRVSQSGTYTIYSHLAICRSAGGRTFTQRIASRRSSNVMGSSGGSSRTLLTDSRLVAGLRTSAGIGAADCGGGEPIDSSVLFGSFRLEANDSLWIEAEPEFAVHRINQASFFGLYQLPA